MDAAIERAKASLDLFIADLRKVPGRSYAIKVAVDTAVSSVEHIWVDAISFSDGVFYGIVQSDPLDLPQYKLGDDIQAHRDTVTDWIIFDHPTGLAAGGWTTEVLQRRW